MSTHRPFLALLSPRQITTFRRHQGPPRDGCWLWGGTIGLHGYGIFGVGARFGCGVLIAHRVAWALAHDIDPGPGMVLHRCNVKACVNPAHLYLGDNAANHRDRVAAGVSGVGLPLAPTQAPACRLSWGVVDEIRRRSAAGETQRALAAAFGISQPQVGRIVRHHQWRDEHRTR